MIQLCDKDMDSLYYVDDEGVQHEVEAVYLGEELVWPEEEGNKILPIHIIGKFADNTDSNNRYVWINGTKYNLAQDFDFKLDEFWKYGKTQDNYSDWIWFSPYLTAISLLQGCGNTTLLEYLFNKTNINKFIAKDVDWDIRNCDSLYNCFNRCTELTLIDLRGLDTSNLTAIADVASNCTKLTSVNLNGVDLSRVYYMHYTFNADTALKDVDMGGCNVGKNTSKPTSFNYMFNNCSALTTLNINGWDFNNASSFNNTFYNCTSLTTVIGLVYNIPISLTLQYSPLTVDSAMVFINGLKDGVSGQTLTLKSATYSQLTPDQLAIGTSKGWTIAKA